MRRSTKSVGSSQDEPARQARKAGKEAYNRVVRRNQRDERDERDEKSGETGIFSRQRAEVSGQQAVRGRKSEV